MHLEIVMLLYLLRIWYILLWDTCCAAAPAPLIYKNWRCAQSQGLFVFWQESNCWVLAVIYLKPCIISVVLQTSQSQKKIPCPISKQHSQINAHLAASICRLLFPAIVAGDNSHDTILERPPVSEPFVSSSDLTVFQSPPPPHTHTQCRPLLIVLYLWWWLSECYPEQPHVCERRENEKCVHVCFQKCVCSFAQGECELWLPANYPACSLFCG